MPGPWAAQEQKDCRGGRDGRDANPDKDFTARTDSGSGGLSSSDIGRNTGHCLLAIIAFCTRQSGHACCPCMTSC